MAGDALDRRGALAPNPDWAMVGVPWPDGQCAIYASTTLIEAELRIEYEREPLFFGVRDWVENVNRRTFLTLEMKDFVVAVAPTYAEALQHLLKTWQPQENHHRRAVPPKAVGDGG